MRGDQRCTFKPKQGKSEPAIKSPRARFPWLRCLARLAGRDPEPAWRTAVLNPGKQMPPSASLRPDFSARKAD